MSAVDCSHVSSISTPWYRCEKLRSTGVTILLVEQNARAALAVADHGYVLEMGDMGLSGPAKALANDPRVIETYLGAARKQAA